MNAPLAPDVERQIAEHLYGGRKIDAIKIHREATGVGLKESKDFVEALEAQLRMREPARFAERPKGKGCAAAAVCVLGLAVALAAALALRG